MSPRKPVRRVRTGVKKIRSDRRIDVTRTEFERVIEVLNARGTMLTDLAHNQDIQFKRIAQLQADFDVLKRALAKLMPAE